MIAGEAVVRAIKAVVAGELGAGRVSTAGGHTWKYHPGLFEQEIDSGDTMFLRAEHHFDIVDGPIQDNAATSESALDSRWVPQMDFTVRVLSAAGKARAGNVLAFQGWVIQAKSVLIEALGFPGNLEWDDSGRATGIVGGCLVAPGGRGGYPIATRGARDCDLWLWELQAMAIFDVEQEV